MNYQNMNQLMTDHLPSKNFFVSFCAEMMKSVVKSARQAGVFKDFHVWSDRPIEDTIHQTDSSASKKTLHLTAYSAIVG